MNWLDRAIGYVAPRAAYRRVQARHALDVQSRYEAARPGRQRPTIHDYASGNVNVQMDARQLRSMARHMDQNHDLFRGANNVMTRNIVGPDGIAVEPRPRLPNGDVDTDLASQLLDLWRDWTRRPEVTFAWGWAGVCRLACRSWIRDGEMFSQVLAGRIRSLDHQTAVPLSLELLESDLVPLDYDRPQDNIRQGVEVNGWGRKLAYWAYREHPGDTYMALGSLYPQVKRVSADRMLHPYMTDRISQLRGVSLFASIITRLLDVKDYEESERVAAKVAASMAGYIKKGTYDDYGAWLEAGGKVKENREMRFRSGMIFDDLMPGEEVGTIGSNRPSDKLTEFRASQLRAAASGADVSYSAMSRDYNGTYSAQRQELVEQWSAYAVLRDQFVSQFVQPVWERFVFTAAAAQLIRMPRQAELASLTAAEFRGPAMPWIDPIKEARAQEILRDAGFKSDQQVIRERGGDPRDVWRQQAEAQQEKRRLGLLEPETTE